MCYAVLPHVSSGLSPDQSTLLEANLGLNLQHDVGIDAEYSWQHKSVTELRAFSNEELKNTCKKYGHAQLNNKKNQLIKTV